MVVSLLHLIGHISLFFSLEFFRIDLTGLVIKFGLIGSTVIIKTVSFGRNLKLYASIIGLCGWLSGLKPFRILVDSTQLTVVGALAWDFNFSVVKRQVDFQTILNSHFLVVHVWRCFFEFIGIL